MGDDRVEITWDDLPEDPPPRSPIPPATRPPTPSAAPPSAASPLPPPQFGPPPGAPLAPAAGLPPISPPRYGAAALPPMPPGAPSPFGYAAPGRSRNNRPLIIGGVIVALVLIVILVNLVKPDEGGDLSRGSSESGSVGIDEDVTYQIDGPGSTVYISVTGENGFDPTVAVEDSSGNTVGYDDDSGGSYDSYLEVYLESGRTYSVVVEGFSGGGGDYRISVS